MNSGRTAWGEACVRRSRDGRSSSKIVLIVQRSGLSNFSDRNTEPKEFF